MAIVRRVRAGCEREFEARLRDFVNVSVAAEGVRGVLALGPVDGGREYGILRSFQGPEERDAFYRSPMFQAWEAQVEPLVEGPPQVRALHGLEAWFRGSAAAPPPRWKMAVVTLLGVYPLALALPVLLQPVTGSLPGWARTLAVSCSMVGLLTWLVMPCLARAARGWLHGTEGTTR